MTLFTKHAAILSLAAGMALAVAGCDKTRDEMRPDMDTIQQGAHGPQSRNLREMTSRMAPDLLASESVVNNPFKIVVVMKDMENDTEDMPGRDVSIYLARLAGLLQSNAASNRVQFVESYAKLQAMRAQEGINPDPFGDAGRAPSTDARLVPQYYLSGKLYSMRTGPTTYYYFVFQMTNFSTGAQAWTGTYDVLTLN